jgi:hypothetical protein
MWRARSIAVVVQRRGFSTAQPPTIVSRRAWEAHRKRHPGPAVSKKAKPKEEEKPWPRNMVLSAYAAAGVFIPYSFGWFLSMHADARRAVTSVVPGLEEVLRSHFGHAEYTSYQDIKDGVEPKMKLDDEDTFAVRRQQVFIEELNQDETPVQIHVFKDGGMVTTSASLKGTTLATSSDLLQEGNGGTVAVDFDDLPSNETSLFDDLATGLSLSADSLANHVYSTWYYQQPANSQERKNVQQASQQDIENTRLEYTIQKLEQDLTDINSTRDIDDMQQELAQCKAELRNLRWKRRLGMA